VHKLLDTVLVDHDAALRWKLRCAQLFPYSAYFEGERSSVIPNSVYNQLGKNSENGGADHPKGGIVSDSVESNGKLEAFKDLTI